MRTNIFLFFLLCSVKLIGQIVDDFDDGNFTANPIWSGSSSFGVENPFEIDGIENQLRSQDLNMGTGTRMAYLSTANVLDLSSSVASWSFSMRLGFTQPGSESTNSNNTSRVYLISNSPNLNEALNGYFVELRYPSTDVNEVRLYRQDGLSITELVLSESIQELTSQEFVGVKISRSETGLWELKVNAVSQGTSSDNTYNASTHFGVQIRYTANSRDNGFYFDDFLSTVTPVEDKEPPSIEEAKAVSSTYLEVKFNEEVEQLSAEDTKNYVLDGGVSIISAVLYEFDKSLLRLTTSTLSNGDKYTITINNIEDLNGNVIAQDSKKSFQYLLLEEPLEQDVLINEFMADPNPVLDFLPDAEYIELYNRSSKFFDLKDWTLDGQTLPTYILGPGQYVIIIDDNDEVLFSSYPEVISISSLSLNNSSLDHILLQNKDASTIHEVSFSGSAGGISTELVNPYDPCLSAKSYLSSIDSNGGTPGRKNSVFDDSNDTEPPAVSGFNLDANLFITFSEVMDASSLLSGNYNITGGLTPNEIIPTGDFPVSVEISFNEPIVEGVVYELTVSEVLDCSGNEIQDTSISFGIGRAPMFNELIITEIMFDPDPQVELPGREFIEIYNTTSEILSTKELYLTDASKSIELPSFILNPGSYYVLASTSAVFEFPVNALGIPGFPSLNNRGEEIFLSNKGQLIFSLAFDPSWHDEAKSDGGYSLEMKDVTNPCLESGINWGSSMDIRGGTPGEQNSISEIIPDNFGPEIINVVAFKSDSIRVDFNEKIEPSHISLTEIILTPSVEIEQVTFNNSIPSSLFVELNGSLAKSSSYQITVNNITDCSGNEIQNTKSFFALSEIPERDEIKLSEVLFNPRSGGVDFIELYNDSDKYLNLKNWQIGNADDDGVIDDSDFISNEVLVIGPNEYRVITTDANILLTNYPQGKSSRFIEIPSMPSYPNDAGAVLLINQEGEIVESLVYDEDYHYNLLESVEGVSLERVSFQEYVTSRDNWRSASSVEGFATPGYLNSQSLASSNVLGKVSVNPAVFIPGNSGSGIDFTTINYQLTKSGQFANVTIYDQRGRLVRNLAEGVLLSTSGFLRWDGDTNSGQMARMGYHLIIFEIYDSNGNSEIIKETVVVGRDF
ncbi:lamin tail domain-containing protein [Ekhidna sp.]